ncbi:hypothetical protein GUITHDRAFT_107688 [Guillardia theta CCMP2712]|uniref:Uncharacterized protein n=1 Tax=Guillardia theta (strain CCMP2712) TaxID=905079 RepID=L1JEB7_GUITC|nr:hypothetical protein GUITHDRAFT_107688 [Guillardia theta CCMP2712]EKX46484.1 hypothetical protein GUITHDRAFT_107688 [Guillardia theta CCMP2712]|eukprot:XP_005833464.1 hypothetical protein GUITHDRAFT_107688 [Guillardia theta CCMP2712]
MALPHDHDPPPDAFPECFLRAPSIPQDDSSSHRQPTPALAADHAQSKRPEPHLESFSSHACRDCGGAVLIDQKDKTETDICLLCLLSKIDASPEEQLKTEQNDTELFLDTSSRPHENQDPKNTKRAWGDVERTAHRQACIGKKRLTLQEKAEIIQLYYRAGQEESPMKQMTIAETYGKSRAAISKLLRPENAHRVMVRFAEKKKAGAKGRPGQRGRGRARPEGKQGDGKEEVGASSSQGKSKAMGEAGLGEAGSLYQGGW